MIYRWVVTATIARKVTEKLFILTHQKLEALRLQTAEERYLDLLSSNRQIMAKIPQYEIASYLNVTPETVSRIRKNLAIRSCSTSMNRINKGKCGYSGCIQHPVSVSAFSSVDTNAPQNHTYPYWQTGGNPKTTP